jgi:hypothetical protein
MTAKIKLNAASGGGSFSLQAPSSSSNNRVFTIPDVADGTIATTATAGKILQIVQTTFTGNESTSSTSFGTTSLSVDITPSATSSKVYVMLTSGWYHGGSDQLFLQLRRDSTVLLPYTGSAGATVTAGASAMLNGSVGTRAKESWNLNVLDSPSTTSATTYAVYWKVNNGTAVLGKWGLNDDFGNVSTITAMEVGN